MNSDDFNFFLRELRFINPEIAKNLEISFSNFFHMFIMAGDRKAKERVVSNLSIYLRKKTQELYEPAHKNITHDLYDIREFLIKNSSNISDDEFVIYSTHLWKSIRNKTNKIPLVELKHLLSYCFQKSISHDYDYQYLTRSRVLDFYEDAYFNLPKNEQVKVFSELLFRFL